MCILYEKSGMPCEVSLCVCARVCVCVATELRLYVFSLLSISVAQGKPEHLEK